MNELDLDALERQLDTTNLGLGTQQSRALIRRLWEAEADHETLIIKLTERNARIAQLERVYEAMVARAALAAVEEKA